MKKTKAKAGSDGKPARGQKQKQAVQTPQPETPSRPKPEQIKLPETYTDPKGIFWMKLQPHRFLAMSERDVKRQAQLREFYWEERINSAGLSLGDQLICKLQTENFVDYAGPLAGYPVGHYITPENKKLLVTEGCNIIKPAKGKWVWLSRFFETLLGSHKEYGSDQVQFFFLWLKVAYEKLIARDFGPAQLLVIAGESGCGKSLCQLIITKALGGRSSDPWQYLTGVTPFNAHLCEAEHHAIDDKSGSLDIASRRQLGENIKQETVVENWCLHDKGKKASFPMPIWKRCSQVINDQPEKMAGGIPPLDDDIRDKIALLHAANAQSVLSEDRDLNMANINRELPAMLFDLLRMKVPEDWSHPRYVVKTYWNPELFELLEGSAPESRLLEFIDQTLWGHPDDFYWQGSATQLEKKLSESTFALAVGKLLPHSNSCGTYLLRLLKKNPERFERTKCNGKTLWKIRKPKAES